jgi:hypothetical protein
MRLSPKPIAAAICVLAALFADAQEKNKEYNPFESIGKKGKIITAYGDKFVEVFDTDSVQRIGSVLYHIYKKKIVVLLNADSLYNEVSDNSSASRWLSIDPLAEKYVSISPYAGMGNNPVLFSDTDGRELIIKGTAAMQDEYARMLTKTTGRQIAINHETGAVSVGDAVKGKGYSTVLANLVDNVVKETYKYQVSLTGGAGDDNGVWIDSYTQGKIDIADLKTIEKGTDNALLAGVLGHFISEISSTDDYNDEGSRGGKFEAAHEKALAKEGEIVGGMLGIGTDKRVTQPEQVSGPKAKEQNVIFSYGSGDKIVKYLLKQGVTGVKVTKGTINIGGVNVPTTTYETVTDGTLKKAKKVNEW